MRAVACGCEDIHEGGVRRHVALYSTCDRLVRARPLENMGRTSG